MAGRNERCHDFADPQEEVTMPNFFLTPNWRGDTPLWRVFWIHGVLGSAILTTLIAAPALSGWFTLPILAAALAVGIAYTAWIVVSNWRCAFNIRDEPLGIDRDAWSMLARWLTVAWAINVLGLSALLVASYFDH
jgi:hypothetical protein